MSLLTLEYKKFLFRKKNIILFTILIIISIGVFLLNTSINSTQKSSKADNLNYNIESLKEAVEKISKEDQTISTVKEINEMYQKELDLVNQQFEAFKNGDWKKELDLQIQIDKLQLESLLTGKSIGGEPIPVIESKIQKNEYLLENNIIPVEDTSSIEGIHHLKNVLNIIFSLLGVIIIILLIGDILAIEFDKGTIKFLFNQEISRSKLLIIKIFVAFSSTVMYIFIVGLLSYLIGYFWDGRGSFNYPISIIHPNGTNLISISEFLIKCSTLFIFVVLFLITFSILMSIITKNSTLTITVVIIISIISSTAIQNGYFSSLGFVFPFTYFNTFSVIDGTLLFNLQNNNISLSTGILVLILSSIICLVFSHLFIKNKEA